MDKYQLRYHKHGRETGTFINYYAGNGLQGNEFSKNAACTDKDGYLIFGGINGITFFRPAEMLQKSKARG